MMRCFLILLCMVAMFPTWARLDFAFTNGVPAGGVLCDGSTVEPGVGLVPSRTTDVRADSAGFSLTRPVAYPEAYRFEAELAFPDVQEYAAERGGVVWDDFRAETNADACTYTGTRMEVDLDDDGMVCPRVSLGLGAKRHEAEWPRFRLEDGIPVRLAYEYDGRGRILLMQNGVTNGESLVDAACGLPEKILSGYTGYFLDKSAAHCMRMIDGLGTNGFNSVDVKIQTTDRRTFDLDGHKADVRALVDRAREHGMAFNVYLYPFPSDAGKRGLPFDRLSTWQQIFPHAVQFARLRKELGFASLRFDIETVEVYEQIDAAKMDAIAAAVKAFADSLRAVDPDLILGYMPADHHKLSSAFDRSLATERLPAVLDSWDMYDGGGYTDEVAKRAAHVKAVHPNNRFVSWIRPNCYYPEDISPSVYQAAKNADGYSIWILTMLDEALRGSRDSTYELPLRDNGTPCYADDYWAGFAAANAALASGEVIPFRKPVSLVPSLTLDGIDFPAAESLPYDATGGGQLQLRQEMTVFVRAQAGESVETTVSHVNASNNKKTAVHYAVLQRDGTVLRNEPVSFGASETFSIPASADDVYAIRVTGGDAWYRVRVTGAATYADARSRSVYLMGAQKFTVGGSDWGNPTLRIKAVSSQEAYRIRLNGGDWTNVVGVVQCDFPLPTGLVSVETAKYVNQPGESYYTQNFRVTFPDGKFPFVMPYREQ